MAVHSLPLRSERIECRSVAHFALFLEPCSIWFSSNTDRAKQDLARHGTGPEICRDWVSGLASGTVKVRSVPLKELGSLRRWADSDDYLREIFS